MRKKYKKKQKKQSWKQYLKSKHWQDTRARKIISAGFKCQQCPNIHNLYVTHIHYKTVNNERDEDLNVYCKECFDSIYKSKQVTKSKRPINPNEECPFDT